MNDFGFLSIVPPLLTIAVALCSKNVLLALATGIMCGSLIITGFNPFYAILNAMQEQVLKEISMGSQVQVIAGVTGLVALFAFGLAGVYESVYVLPIAIVVLSIAMFILMKLLGSKTD